MGYYYITSMGYDEQGFPSAYSTAYKQGDPTGLVKVYTSGGNTYYGTQAQANAWQRKYEQEQANLQAIKEQTGQSYNNALATPAPQIETMTENIKIIPSGGGAPAFYETTRVTETSDYITTETSKSGYSLVDEAGQEITDYSPSKNYLPVTIIEESKTPSVTYANMTGINKGILETKESYDRRLSVVNQLDNYQSMLKNYDSTVKNLNPSASYIIDNPNNNSSRILTGSQIQNEYNNSWASLYNKASAKQTISSLKIESNREEKSFFGSIADVYRSEKGKVLNTGIELKGSSSFSDKGMNIKLDFQEPLARASEGFETIEAGFKVLAYGGYKIASDPLGSLANIAIGVGSLGVVPAYNIASSVGKAYGVNSLPSLIVETPYNPLEFFGVDKKVKSVINSWQPLNPFNPETKLSPELRGVGMVGTIGTVLAVSYGIGAGVVKPLTNKLMQVEKINSFIDSVKISEKEFINWGSTRLKNLFGVKDVNVFGRTKVIDEITRTENGVSLTNYMAKSDLIATGFKEGISVNEYGKILTSSQGRVISASIAKSGDDFIGVGSVGSIVKNLEFKPSVNIDILRPSISDVSYYIPETVLTARGFGNIYKITPSKTNLDFNQIGSFGYAVDKIMPNNVKVDTIKAFNTKTLSIYGEGVGTSSTALSLDKATTQAVNSMISSSVGTTRSLGAIGVVSIPATQLSAVSKASVISEPKTPSIKGITNLISNESKTKTPSINIKNVFSSITSSISKQKQISLPNIPKINNVVTTSSSKVKEEEKITPKPVVVTSQGMSYLRRLTRLSDQKTGLKTGTKTGFNIITVNETTTPKPSINFNFPSFGGGITKGLSSLFNFKGGYKPSLKSLFTGETSTKMPKLFSGRLTGLEERPIIVKHKKKRARSIGLPNFNKNFWRF